MRKPILMLGAMVIMALALQFAFDTKEDQPFAHQIAQYEKYKDLSYEEIQALPKRDRPDLALLQEFEITKDIRLGYPPVERKIAAHKIARQKLAAQAEARTIDGVEWTERGPNNVGGRTRALMFDPNDETNKKVWAAGISGGIWYIDDITSDESSWVNVDDFMASLSVATLAYDPNSTTTFYAGTGESFTRDFRGAGLWKSIDAGTTWTQIENTTDFGYTNKIVVTSSSTLIAATTSKGIQTSTDGGATWNSPENVTGNMADLELAPDGTLVCSDNSGNIFKSTDDAINWVSISPDLGGERVEVAIAPSNSQVIYAVAASGSDVGWMAKTTNGGTTWTEIAIPMYLDSSTCEESDDDFSRGQAWYDLILAVNPTNENEVIVGGIDLHKSTTAGATWTAISYWTGGCRPLVHADQHAIAFRPGSSSEAIFGNDGGVWYSSNIDEGSPDFAMRNNDYNVTQFYATAIRNEINSNDMLAGSQDNGTQQFRTFGVNSTIEATGGDGGYCFIDQDEPNLQITSYVYNNYYLSRDGGASFSGFGTGNSGGFINQCDYDNDANILYARGSSSNMMNRYTITESGVDQASISIAVNGSITHILTSPFENHVLYIGTSNGTVNKVNQANADAPVPTELADFVGTVTAIDVSDNGNHILVTVGNYGAKSVWYSADAGSTWTDIEGDLPDMPVWWGMFNPNDDSQVILATEVGVWTSDDITASSVTWGPSNAGLANVQSRMLQYRTSDQTIALATHGRGLYTTTSFSQTTFVDFAAENFVTYVGKQNSFTNQSSKNITTFNWNISDGSTYNTEDISHAFTSAGWHHVSLTSADGTVKSKRVFVLPRRPANYVAELENEPVDTYPDHRRGDVGFELGNSDIDGKNGVTSGENAWVLGLDDETYTDETTVHLYFPEYDFTADGTYSLSFQTNYSFEDNWDGFIIEYSTDQGAHWIKLGDAVEEGWYNQISDPQAVFGASVPIFSGNTTGYELKEKDVSFLATEAHVAFRLVYMSDAAEVDTGMAIDDIKVTGPDSDPVPNFSLVYHEEYCTGSIVTFYDNSSIDASSHSWDFGADATPATATGEGPHQVTYSTSGSKSISLTVDSDFTETKSNFLHIQESMTQSASFELSGASLCPGDAAELVVKNSETGKSYKVYADGSNEPVSTAQEGNGGDLTFRLGTLDKTTSYYVSVSKSGFCTFHSDLLEASVSGLTETALSNVTTLICSGNTASASILQSIDGVSYQLVIGSTGVASGEAVTGDGGTITLTSAELTESVNLKIVANDPSFGCDITFAAVVEVEVSGYPDATITESNFVLSVPEGADEYVWHLNNTALPGFNTHTYEATKNGTYHVIVTNNGCESVSEKVTLVVTAIAANQETKIYPNPSNGSLQIERGNFDGIRLYTISGSLMYSASLHGVSGTIDLSHLENGLYLIELYNKTQSQKQKLILRK